MSEDSYSLLAIAAETLSDVERVRIATENRTRALVHPEQNICLPPDHATVKAAEALTGELAKIEKQASKTVALGMRATPLAGWAKAQIGLGEKQVGRLLGTIGNPCWRFDPDTEEWRERTIAQLWSYAGYGVWEGGIAPHRKKGEQGRWNPAAKMRAFLIAESCIKQMESPYREVYDAGREKYADATHSIDCKRCGPSGKPAKVGSDLSDGHKHARAMRLVAKAILKDLWLVAEGQAVSETQITSAPAPAEDSDRELVAA